MKPIPIQKPFIYARQKFSFINYGRKADKIFIIELNNKGNRANIQYQGVSCSQATVKGFVFKTFKSKSKWFNTTWWYRWTCWSNDSTKIFFKTDKFKMKLKNLFNRNNEVYQYATEHGTPVDSILKTILKGVENKTGIKFELDFYDLTYGKCWAEAYIPLTYNGKKYLLTWQNCD
jgi:hypothetical protein